MGLSSQFCSAVKMALACATRKVAERLDRDEFDLVTAGRAIMHDPAWFRRVRNGEPLLAYDEDARHVLT